MNSVFILSTQGTKMRNTEKVEIMKRSEASISSF